MNSKLFSVTNSLMFCTQSFVVQQASFHVYIYGLPKVHKEGVPLKRWLKTWRGNQLTAVLCLKKSCTSMHTASIYHIWWGIFSHFPPLPLRRHTYTQLPQSDNEGHRTSIGIKCTQPLPFFSSRYTIGGKSFTGNWMWMFVNSNYTPFDKCWYQHVVAVAVELLPHGFSRQPSRVLLCHPVHRGHKMYAVVTF